MMKRVYVIVFAALVFSALPLSVQAGETEPYPVTPGERFGRGMINIISSPLELPAQMYSRASYQQETKGDPFSIIGGYLEGIPMGIIYIPWRLGAGLYDIFTFPFESCNESIIDPEYVTFSADMIEDKKMRRK